jgi:hypothetical protein
MDVTCLAVEVGPAVLRLGLIPTTETLPAAPAAIHGQNTRVPGCARVIGADHVFPRSSPRTRA